jgi:hypothetical protein
MPAPGHRFGAFGGALAGAPNPSILVMDTDKSVSATFVAQHTLSVAPGAGGAITLDPPGGTYDAGTTVRLTATAGPRHRFNTWSGALAGSQNPATLVMNADKSVAAAFVPQYRLILVPSAAGSVGVDPPGGTYDAGTLVRLSATAAPGYRFGGWSGHFGGT